MRVSLDWLRECVSVEVPVATLAERLTVSSCEVERVFRRGVADEDGNLGLFRVGRVLDAEKHPNADRLQLCRVDVGETEPRQIVCGAWNFGTGATVAVALPGAVLPDGQRLERATLRGALSDGMILSERELHLGPDHAGILVLGDAPDPGTPLSDVLPLGEDVLEVEVTPNRPDLLSVYGLAREVAAIFDAELRPSPTADYELRGDEHPDIQVDDIEGCPRYIGRLFRDVRVTASPPLVRARLVAAGMRPVSNVVDATNYAMLALGSPLHAFDLTKLRGRRIVVRRAHEGEQIRTLDGTLRTLDARDLVIADAECPVAIAGVMGSADSEVDEATTEVLLEAANFEPIGILKTSERLGLRSESSGRWEKGIDPHLAEQAAALCSGLLVEHADAVWTGHVDVHHELPARPVVRLRPERASQLIGLEVAPDEQRELLPRLGFDVGESWDVLVPTWRARDVTREVDLIEEIARLKLDEVPYTFPLRRELHGRLTREQRLRRLVEDVLVGCGFFEAYTPSLVADDPDPEALRLPEPQSADQAVLRTTLLPSLVDALRHNVAVGNEGVALFEIARVYLPSGGELPDERWRVAGVSAGGFPRAKGVVETLHEALGIRPLFERGASGLLHPGKTARLETGIAGELHPTLIGGSWGGFELDLAALLAAAPEESRYEDVITFPAVKQDLAFVVDQDVPAGKLVDAVRGAVPEVREMRVFDVYRGEQVGEGRKSLAFHVEFQSPERTLSDEDAAELRSRLVATLGERFGAVLRD